MSTIKSLSRLGAVLASLAVVAVSFASSAMASTSVIPVGGSGGQDGTTAPATVVHTVVVGGMPGWQIAAIAVAAGPPANRRQPVRRTDMPRFMDFHADLKLPPEAIAQIADNSRNERADEFGVRQVELYHNADGQVYCLLEGPDEDAIRKHHAALGLDCGAVHRVDGIA
jgi:hypothetical protein